MTYDLLDKLATRTDWRDSVGEMMDKIRRADEELYDDLMLDVYLAVNGAHFDRETYDEAVKCLKNKDGSKGAHWTVDEITSYAKNHGLRYDHFNEYDFAYAMNVMYSDYYGIIPDNVENYYRMARAFLEDEDAPEGKAWLYHEAMAH